MRKFSVIQRPILTERTYMQSSMMSKYTFAVLKDASKGEIKEAFREIFKIEPIKINIINSKPSYVRTGTRFPSLTAHVKKAIITLPPGTKLNLLGEEEGVNAEEAAAPEAPVAKEKPAKKKAVTPVTEGEAEAEAKPKKAAAPRAKKKAPATGEEK